MSTVIYRFGQRAKSFPLSNPAVNIYNHTLSRYKRKHSLPGTKAHGIQTDKKPFQKCITQQSCCMLPWKRNSNRQICFLYTFGNKSLSLIQICIKSVICIFLSNLLSYVTFKKNKLQNGFKIMEDILEFVNSKVCFQVSVIKWAFEVNFNMNAFKLKRSI